MPYRLNTVRTQHTTHKDMWFFFLMQYISQKNHIKSASEAIIHPCRPSASVIFSQSPTLSVTTTRVPSWRRKRSFPPSDPGELLTGETGRVMMAAPPSRYTYRWRAAKERQSRASSRAGSPVKNPALRAPADRPSRNSRAVSRNLGIICCVKMKNEK